MDGTDSGQGGENTESEFKRAWEFEAVHLRYLLDIQIESSSK